MAEENFNWLGEEDEQTPTKKSPDPLENVLPFDRPMSSGPKDRWVGEDELGNSIYQTQFGKQYIVRPATKEEIASRQPLPVKAKEWWDKGANIPDFDQVVDVVKSLPEEAYNTIDRLISGDGTYRDAMDVVATMAAPGASKVLSTPDTSLTRMFFGPESPKADMWALEKAKDLQEQGFPEQEIWLRTGWWEGPNGWKFEVSDEDFDFSPQVKQIFEQMVEKDGIKGVGQLKDLILHKDFYNSLPISDKAKNRLLNASLSFQKDNTSGTFYKSSGDIGVSALTEDELKSVTLHELQHYVQSLEDASEVGTNSAAIEKSIEQVFTELPIEAKEYLATIKLYEDQLKDFTEKRVKAPKKGELKETNLLVPTKEDYDEAIDQVIRDIEADDNLFEMSLGSAFIETLQSFYEETGGFGGRFKIEKYGPVAKPDQQYLKELSDAAFTLYEKNPGEVEARLTSKRKDLNSAERALRVPSKDLDVSSTLSSYDLRKILNNLSSEADNFKQSQKTNKYAKGGMVENQIDPVSGNQVPPGAKPKEVRDDVPIMASEGEYVIPANVVRFIGLDKIEKMVSQANEKLKELESKGRIGGAKEEDLPFSPEELRVVEDSPQTVPQMAEGGLVYSPTMYNSETDPETGLPIWMSNKNKDAQPVRESGRDRGLTNEQGPTGLAGSVDQWTPKEFQTYARTRNSMDQKAGQALVSYLPFGGLMAKARERYLERTVPKELENMLSNKTDLQGNPLDEEALSGLQNAYDQIKSEAIDGFGRRGLLKQVGRETGIIKKPTSQKKLDKQKKAVEENSLVNRLIDAVAKTGKKQLPEEETSTSSSKGEGDTSTKKKEDEEDK